MYPEYLARSLRQHLTWHLKLVRGTVAVPTDENNPVKLVKELSHLTSLFFVLLENGMIFVQKSVKKDADSILCGGPKWDQSFE